MGPAIVDDAYFDWLCEQVHYYQGDGYDILMTILFDKSFEWYVANDDNRAADGIQLRTIFMDKEGWYTEPLYGEECNCLELFVGMAKRIEDDIMWDGEHDRTSDWFWMMLRNMDLTEYLDSDPDAIEKIEEVLGRFMRREYRRDGDGGPFPLHFSGENDQREVELWYQMQAYMMENYDF